MDTQTTSEQPKNKVYFYIFLVVVVVFLFIAVTMVTQKGGFKSSQQTPVTEPEQQQEVTHGTLSLKAASEPARYASASPVTLTLQADSEGQDIVGYDALVSYDAEAFEFVSAASTIPSFRVFAKDNAGVVSLTGLKTPQVTDASVLASTDLVSLTFRSKSTGSFTFSVLPRTAKEKTKLVNTATTILTPAVSELEVEIY